MNLRLLLSLLGVAVLATATAANAAVHTVDPDDDVQAVIDSADAGDTILFEPGLYTTSNADFGLHITTDGLRLIGKVDEDAGPSGKVRLRPTGTQQIGVYAAPAGCGPSVDVGNCPAPNLQGFEIRNFAVEDFPSNGIQTRFVNDFKIISNESIRNLNNGIYPTISVNGLVKDNLSYGALDTAAWVAACENVRVIDNEFRDSVIGFEISVSNNVVVKNNDIHDNTVGMGLFHPNAAGNDPLPVMENWIVEDNDVYDNNKPNAAPPTSFQGGLPPGVGILVLGVSTNEIKDNRVSNNDFVGIGVLGWCTATATNPLRNCFASLPKDDPSVNDNLVADNEVRGNGGLPPGGPFAPIQFLAADITYFSDWPVPPPNGPETSSGNCFEDNEPDGFTSVSSEPDGELPTDGCVDDGDKDKDDDDGDKDHDDD